MEMLLLKDKWLITEVPLLGTRQAPVENLHGASWPMGHYRITVLDGPITIKSVAWTRKHNTKIKGVTTGQRFETGQVFEIKVFIGPVTTDFQGWDMVSYKVGTEEIGIILDASTQIYK
jgi:hypothetical protein